MTLQIQVDIGTVFSTYTYTYLPLLNYTLLFGSCRYTSTDIEKVPPDASQRQRRQNVEFFAKKHRYRQRILILKISCSSKISLGKQQKVGLFQVSLVLYFCNKTRILTLIIEIKRMLCKDNDLKCDIERGKLVLTKTLITEIREFLIITD